MQNALILWLAKLFVEHAREWLAVKFFMMDMPATECDACGVVKDLIICVPSWRLLETSWTCTLSKVNPCLLLSVAAKFAILSSLFFLLFCQLLVERISLIGLWQSRNHWRCCRPSRHKWLSWGHKSWRWWFRNQVRHLISEIEEMLLSPSCFCSWAVCRTSSE